MHSGIKIFISCSRIMVKIKMPRPPSSLPAAESESNRRLVTIKMPSPPASLPPAEPETSCRLETKHGKILLVNSETNTQVALPQIFPDSSGDNSLIHKYAVSLPPSGLTGTNCCVVAIVGESKQLACFTADTQSWILLQESDFDDLLFHEGHVYAVDECGRVVMCVIDYFASTIQAFREVTERWFLWGDRVYLTVVNGGGKLDSLLLIVRYWKKDDKRGETTSYMFRACALDYPHGKTGYVVHSLNNWTVLLGRTKTVSFGPYGGNGGFRPNCIYFLDAKGERHIPRVYSMDDKSIEELQDSKEASSFLAATTN